MLARVAVLAWGNIAAERSRVNPGKGWNVSEKVNEVCIHAACGRSFPLRVVHCPFCGTRQAGAAPVLTEVAAPAPVMPDPVPPPLPIHAITDCP